MGPRGYFKYDDFMNIEPDDDFSEHKDKVNKDAFLIMNIFSKGEIVKYFGYENLIYFDSLINLQVINIEYKRLLGSLSPERYIFDHNSGNFFPLNMLIKNYKFFYKYNKLENEMNDFKNELDKLIEQDKIKNEIKVEIVNNIRNNSRNS